jgi:hypothetical protein
MRCQICRDDSDFQRKISQNFVSKILLEQVFCDDHPLDLIGTFVDLGGLADSSTSSTTPVIVRNFVHHVHLI